MAKPTPALSLSDFDEAEQQPGSKCWFVVKLNDEQRRAVVEAHEAGRTLAAISRVLTGKIGSRVTQGAVGHHFSGDCRCGR